MGAKPLKVTELLPTDLDYRLTHPGTAEPEHWNRERKGDLAALVREGLGEPWIIVHGLLSGPTTSSRRQTVSCRFAVRNGLRHSISIA
ncbi:hypothetical protein SAMN04487970_101973 [Paenibacillus tianmuensis]|uniref:Uncharacterized protein n=1 Tax=Paenibacillus tianmuensis TaxID=624147 RepID=A0A1G4RU41_9BACL|nr:hypothetical protein [Paenibacillus tianmuensis]SCW60522.1 hypothetical protein SAMN04487970_101973 [Paenibacillus tianmuensis]